jgi:hypothetical protein
LRKNVNGSSRYAWKLKYNPLFPGAPRFVITLRSGQVLAFGSIGAERVPAAHSALAPV